MVDGPTHAACCRWRRPTGAADLTRRVLRLLARPIRRLMPPRAPAGPLALRACGSALIARVT